MASPVAFYLMAALIVGTALAVVSLRNILHAGLNLVMCFWGVAGMYLLLDAPFLSVIQVLIYIGAIAVLLLFAIMLTHRISSRETPAGQRRYALSALGSILFVSFAMWGILQTPVLTGATPQPGRVPTLLDLAVNFMDPARSLVPFELVAILLLVALVGAVIVARKDERHEAPPQPPAPAAPQPSASPVTEGTPAA